MGPLVLLLFGWTATALAHGGGLDGHGCHNDRKHGGYHCHRGAYAGETFTSQAEMLGAGSGRAKLSGAESAAFGPCGSKTVCTQMASCDEARFFLTACGLGRLDGDGDGKPCENVCRQGCVRPARPRNATCRADMSGAHQPGRALNCAYRGSRQIAPAFQVTQRGRRRRHRSGSADDIFIR